tara:strand:- start:12150 stop:12293 length:144 start_codon:yes stop_codon:yes gene_type:complete
MTKSSSLHGATLNNPGGAGGGAGGAGGGADGGQIALQTMRTPFTMLE